MSNCDYYDFTLSCTNCPATEESSAKDRGTSAPGREIDWGTPSFSKFKATVTGGGYADPQVTDATCLACGHPAKVTSSLR